MWTTHSNNSQEYRNNLLKRNKANSKEIIQYDINKKNFIKEHKNIYEIIKDNPQFSKRFILANMKKNKPSYGFFWEFKNPEKVNEIILKKNEIFKPLFMINGHDFSLYEVSNFGNVRNRETNKLLKAALNDKGYYKVILTDKNIPIGKRRGINMDIHRLVAITFVKGKSEINDRPDHLDGNKLNNYEFNFEWVSNRENMTRASGRKVHQIDINTNEIIKTFDSIARANETMNMFGSSSISKVCMGKNKSAQGFKWQYAT